MEGFETVAAIAAESKPLDEPTDEQTEAHLAMLSKSVPLPSISSTSSSSYSSNITTNNLPSISASRSTMGSKDFMSTIGEGNMANILDLLNSNKSFSSNDGNGSSDGHKIENGTLNGNSSNSVSRIDSGSPSKMEISSSETHSNTSQPYPSIPSSPSSSTSTQIVPSNHPMSIVVSNQQVINQSEGDKENFVDITEFLNLPQTEAAKKLGIPTSTLSKRWKEAAVNRKWPYRTVAKLDKEIMTLLHNIPQGSDAPPLPAEIENNLGALLRKRQDELRTVVIRL